MLFTGRLTANAEVRTVKNDKTVTNFTVALNKRYKTKSGEKQEKTAFIDCAYWVNAGLAEYLTKGAIVEISGWMEAQAWVNKNNEAQARLICSCDTIKLFSSPAKAEEQAEATNTAKAKAKQSAGTAGADDDDLPF